MAEDSLWLGKVRFQESPVSRLPRLGTSEDGHLVSPFQEAPEEGATQETGRTRQEDLRHDPLKSLQPWSRRRRSARSATERSIVSTSVRTGRKSMPRTQASPGGSGLKRFSGAG